MRCANMGRRQESLVNAINLCKQCDDEIDGGIEEVVCHPSTDHLVNSTLERFPGGQFADDVGVYRHLKPRR